MHSTPTKAARPPVGLEPVRHAAVHARQPWFAIGGIDETNVGEVVAAGAHRIAVVRAIGDVPDPELAARTPQGRLWATAGLGLPLGGVGLGSSIGRASGC